MPLLEWDGYFMSGGTLCAFAFVSVSSDLLRLMMMLMTTMMVMSHQECSSVCVGSGRGMCFGLTSRPRRCRQRPFLAAVFARTPTSRSCNRWHCVEDPSHLIRRHLAVLHAADLAALAQTLQANGDFPALRLIDEEDIFLVVGIADRSTEDVEMFGRLLASLVTPLVCYCKIGNFLGRLTSTIFNVQALTSHSRCGMLRTSSSINRPSDWILRIRPSVTLPTLDTS